MSDTVQERTFPSFEAACAAFPDRSEREIHRMLSAGDIHLREPKKIIAGIDPGLAGGISLMRPDGTVIDIVDMPVHELKRGGRKKREIDVQGVVAILSGAPIEHAVIEQAQARPARRKQADGSEITVQGSSGTFATGKGYGILIGVLGALGIPVTEVQAAVWKRKLQVPAAKDASRARASQLMPREAARWRRVKDHGRAESALICSYGLRMLAGVASESEAKMRQNRS